MRIADIAGIVFLVCVTHFAMLVLIRAELKVNPNPADGFLFRWKATRWPVMCLVAIIVFIYTVYFADYHLTLHSLDETGETFFIAGGKLLIVTGITTPVIVFDLLNYNKTGDHN